MNQQTPGKPKKLRQACDSCHNAKMRCGGGNPCVPCSESGGDCTYSVSNRIGRPKGTKNKRTLQRLTHKPVSEKDQCHSNHKSMPSRTSSGFESPISPAPTFSDDLSSDSLLSAGSEFAYPLPTSEPAGPDSLQYVDPLDTTWCDLDDLSGVPFTTSSTYPLETAPDLKQQPGLIHSDLSNTPPLKAPNDHGSIAQAHMYGATPYLTPPVSRRSTLARPNGGEFPDANRYSGYRL